MNEHRWKFAQRVVLSDQRLFLATCLDCDAIEIASPQSTVILNTHGIFESPPPTSAVER